MSGVAPRAVEMIRKVWMDVTPGQEQPPARWRCVACEEMRTISVFRPKWRKPEDGHPAAWAWLRWCNTCATRHFRGKLEPDQAARLDAVRAEIERQLDATHDRRERKSVPVASPYERVAEAMARELGRPEREWTRAEDLECTRRIYKALGWDEDGLKRGSPAHRLAVRQRLADAAPAATIDDEEEEEG